MENLWECEDKEYQIKIVERLAELTDEELTLEDGINMPPIYEAIFRGSMEWLVLFEEMMFKDRTDPKRYQTVKWKDKFYSFSMRFHSATRKFYFSDPLTAAVWSNNSEMVKYISQTVELPDKVSGLKEAIAGSNWEITNYMIGKYPQYVETIEPSYIIDGKNQRLLMYYLEHHPEDIKECVEKFRLNRQNGFPRVSRLEESGIEAGGRFYEMFFEMLEFRLVTGEKLVPALLNDIHDELMKRNEIIDLGGFKVNRNEMEYIPEIDEKLELFRIYLYWGGKESEELAEYLYEEYVNKYDRKQVYWKEKWKNRGQIKKKTIQLKDLVGKHLLSGVEYRPSIRGVEENNNWEYTNDALLCLDGITYLLTEDAEDSHRSYMTEVEVTDLPVRNTFPPQLVNCELDVGTSDDENDILNVYSEEGALILRVGTESYMDYYPCAIFEFHPENMTINQRDDSENILGKES